MSEALTVQNIRRPDPGASTNAYLFFDVATDLGIYLFGLALVRTERGWRLRSPRARDKATMMFGADTANHIISLVLKASAANDKHAA